MLCTRLACLRQSGHRPGRAVDTASTTKTLEKSLTRSTRTSIPENSTSSTVLLATAGDTLPKRSLVPAADLGIHETADRAIFRERQQRGLAARPPALQQPHVQHQQRDSYDSFMVYGTPDRGPYRYGPSSCWVYVTAAGAEGQWILEEGMALRRIFERLRGDGGIDLARDVYGISPSRGVVLGAREDLPGPAARRSSRAASIRPEGRRPTSWSSSSAQTRDAPAPAPGLPPAPISCSSSATATLGVTSGFSPPSPTRCPRTTGDEGDPSPPLPGAFVRRARRPPRVWTR